MAILPALLGMLAVGGAGLAMQNTQRERHNRGVLLQQMIKGAVEGGMPEAFDDPNMRKMMKEFLGSEEYADQAKALAAFNSPSSQAERVGQRLNMLRGQGLIPETRRGQGAPTASAPLGNTQIPTVDTGEGPMLPATAVTPQAPTPAPSSASMTTGEASQPTSPTISMPSTSPVVARPKVTTAIEPMSGKVTSTVTEPTTSEEIATAKLPGELQAQQGALQEQERLRQLHLTELKGRTEILGHMLNSAQEPTLAGKLTHLERALATATGTGLSDAQTTIKDQIDKIREEVRRYTEPPDLSKPDVAKYVSDTGTHPITGMPVPKEVQDRATKFVTSEQARQVAQREALGKVMSDLQLKELPKRVAITSAMRNLTQQGDAVQQFQQKFDQVDGALKTMEANLSVFPSNVTGRVSAQFSKFIQDQRGQVILQLQQAVNILQSAEARFMAGEVGRIPMQLENQWRETLADPTKVTRSTAEGLIKSTRARLADIAKGRERSVTRQADVARRSGIPAEIVDAFTKGDIEVLRQTQGEALKNGSLPPVLSIGDLK